MFWIVQKNLFNEQAFQSLIDQLVKQHTPHAVVHLLPFIHEIEPDVVIQNPVFACGSTSMRKVAKNKQWVPGYFDQNLDYRLLLHHYGSRMLNQHACISALKDAQVVGEYLFIRPVGDDKQFAGQVMSANEFISWREKIIALEGESTYGTLTGNDEVVIAEPKPIAAEYRFYVVDGKVVTWSQYKLGNKSHYDSNVDEKVVLFAQECVDLWSPNRAFCLDIADIADGLKVLEINSINSSGFYACDMGKFVKAINAMCF